MTLIVGAISPDLVDHVDRDLAFRTAISGKGGEKFLKSLKEVKQVRAEREQQMQQMQQMQQAQQMADMAPKVGSGVKQLSDAAEKAGQMDTGDMSEDDIMAMFDDLQGSQDAAEGEVPEEGQVVDAQ